MMFTDALITWPVLSLCSSVRGGQINLFRPADCVIQHAGLKSSNHSSDDQSEMSSCNSIRLTFLLHFCELALELHYTRLSAHVALESCACHIECDGSLSYLPALIAFSTQIKF